VRIALSVKGELRPYACYSKRWINDGFITRRTYFNMKTLLSIGLGVCFVGTHWRSGIQDAKVLNDICRINSPKNGRFTELN
jgi:hypothetical protein